MSEITTKLIEDDCGLLLILESEEFPIRGYRVNRNTGNLRPVCLCFAHYSNECLCGYEWDEE